MTTKVKVTITFLATLDPEEDFEDNEGESLDVNDAISQWEESLEDGTFDMSEVIDGGEALSISVVKA